MILLSASPSKTEILRSSLLCYVTALMIQWRFLSELQPLHSTREMRLLPLNH
jgi:hypothetical protein